MNYKPGKLAIGPLSPSGPGSHWMPKRIVLDVPARVVNATSTERLDLSHEHRNRAVRPGSEQFLQYPSRGLGC